MTPKFIADPPAPIRRGSIVKHFRRLAVGFGWILWQIVVPFESLPKEIDDLPDPKNKVEEEQLKQCQYIFDQAKDRRSNLEQKAQSTFGLMVFLVPTLGSLFVFIISKGTAAGAGIRTAAISLLVLSAGFLMLGFISAVRAVSVKAVKTLYLDAVIQKEDGQFRTYDKGFHARGLLYCAAMNEAINDHIAQFVKGAHVMTGAAVIALVIAAVPATFMFSGASGPSTETKIVGTVEVSSPEVGAIRDDVANLKADVGKLLSNSQAAGDDLRQLQDRFSKLDTKLSRMQRPIATGSSKK